MNESFRNLEELVYGNVIMTFPAKIITPPFNPALACGEKSLAFSSPELPHPVLDT